jgi:hypothetical protein
LSAPSVRASTISWATPQLDKFADRLVSDPKNRSSEKTVAVIDVEIATTYAAGFDPDDGVAIVSQHGIDHSPVPDACGLW